MRDNDRIEWPFSWAFWLHSLVLLAVVFYVAHKNDLNITTFVACWAFMKVSHREIVEYEQRRQMEKRTMTKAGTDAS